MRGPPHRLVNEIDTIKEGYAQCVLNTVVDKIYCRCAAIFIDNSGVDIILGVMPFVEELLRRGTKVLLCANNRPVLNDVTYAELELILQRVSPLSEVLSDALANGKLECLDSGQGSP